ncbi:MAG: transaldolase [Dehalococcoidia bacterium]
MALPAPLQRLRSAQQSVWLDFIDRHILDSGELARLIEDGWLQGMTSNPTIFAKAITGSDDYDDDLQRIAESGETDPYAAFVQIAADDIGRAADAFLPIYEANARQDGFVSLELPPGIERDTAASVAEAKRLFGLLGRPNIMIKVPGTAEGLPAVTELIAEGVNVNITLLFAVSTYERVAEAYIEGLERRHAAGLPLDSVASVASFFVSRVDTAVDEQLPEDSPLRGRVAIGNSLLAYERFGAIFAGPRWEALAAAGARPQRPLWASTSTKNPAYPDTLYVDQLVVPHTVNTLPLPTIEGFADHGDGTALDAARIAEGAAVVAEARAAGVDLDAVTDKLLVDGLASFAADFERLLEAIRNALGAVKAAS